MTKTAHKQRHRKALPPPSPLSRIEIWIAGRLKQRRIDMQMTRPELADKVGVEKNQITRYELLMARISIERLAELASALHVPVSYFVEGFDQHDDGTLPADPMAGMTAETMEFMRVLDGLPQDTRALLRSLVRHISAISDATEVPDDPKETAHHAKPRSRAV